MFPSLQFFGKSYPTNIWSTHVYHVCKKYRYSCSYICMFLLVVLLLWLVKCVKLTFIAWGITEDQTVRTLVVIHSSNYIIHNIYIYYLFYLFIYLFWLEHFGREFVPFQLFFSLPKSKTRSSWICILNGCSDREDPGGSCKVCKVLLSASWTHGCHAEWCIVGPGGSLCLSISLVDPALSVRAQGRAINAALCRKGDGKYVDGLESPYSFVCFLLKSESCLQKAVRLLVCT